MMATISDVERLDMMATEIENNDGPVFQLVASDENAPMVIEVWAHMLAAKSHSLDDRRKVKAALECAASMRSWLAAKLGE